MIADEPAAGGFALSTPSASWPSSALTSLPPPASAHDGPRAALARVRAEVGKAVVGQDSVVSGLLIALICEGHVLLEGVPGVAKTLLIRALASALSLE